MAEPELAPHAKIRCRTIIEVLGKPKDYVETTIREYVKKIKEDDDFVVISDEFSDAQEQDNGYWSVFVEMEFLVKGLQPLVGFCFNYMPSSIEIIKPSEMVMSSTILNRVFNDLQARLHTVDMVAKKQSNEIAFLRKNLNAAMKNMVLVAASIRPLKSEQLSKITGVSLEALEPFVKELVKEEKLRKDGDTYTLNSKKTKPSQ